MPDLCDDGDTGMGRNGSDDGKKDHGEINDDHIKSVKTVKFQSKKS